jgi:hypothetical protein
MPQHIWSVGPIIIIGRCPPLNQDRPFIDVFTHRFNAGVGHGFLILFLAFQ